MDDKPSPIEAWSVHVIYSNFGDHQPYLSNGWSKSGSNFVHR